MAKNKSKFELRIEEISKLNKSSAFSTTTLYDLSGALLNDPDYTAVTVVSKDGKPETESSQPVAEFRNGLKKLVKDEFGIDSAEAAKLDTAAMNKTITKSVADMSGLLIRGYLDTGKAYKFPMMGTDEARMQIAVREVDETTEATNKIEKQADGTYASVPTGKTVKTKKHTELKASNKKPAWLKEEV